MESNGHRILVVDDDPDVRRAHSRFAASLGYEAETASDGLEALAKLVLDVDLVLLDAQMSKMDGFQVARRIRERPEHEFLPIIMVTGLHDESVHRRAMEAGINDVITKPINADELHLRTRWLLALKRAHDSLNEEKGDLERSVSQRTDDLRLALEEVSEAKRRIYDAHLDTIRRLTVAAEFKDKDTAGHIERIGLYSEVLAKAAGLGPGHVETIRHAAPMHDVGKLGVPDELLLKPSKLNEVEWAVMKTHTTLGADLLAGSDSEVIQMGERIALSHHERWDGTGYPGGLAGEGIPLEARICTVVDYFDATTMDRPYRAALPVRQVLMLMRRESQMIFDPDLLDTFFECLDEIQDIRRTYTVS